jgi:uncharacterized protein with PQ loop repeat
MMNLFLTLTVVSANVLGGAMAFPQAARLVRTRRVEGVSAAWVGISVAMNLWWLAYGVTEQRWALIPVSAISIILYGAIGLTLVATLGVRRASPMAMAFLALAVVPIPFLVGSGWRTVGVVIGLCYGVQLMPAVVSACRSADLAGVSSGTWVIASAESLLWGIYGVALADAGLVVAGVLGVAMSSLIIARLIATGSASWAPARWRSAEAELSW